MHRTTILEHLNSRQGTFIEKCCFKSAWNAHLLHGELFNSPLPEIIVSTDSLHSITSSDTQYSSQNDYADLYKSETNISQILTMFPPEGF
jgi:hypothetical protein